MANTTRGAERQGYRGGRPVQYPPGTETTKVLVALSPKDLAKVRALGDGYLARGLRRALDYVPDNV